jgi:hypothetical protein
MKVGDIVYTIERHKDIPNGEWAWKSKVVRIESNYIETEFCREPEPWLLELLDKQISEGILSSRARSFTFNKITIKNYFNPITNEINVKIKRIWCYIQKPAQHEISCPKCKGTNLDWSEWDKHIWCYNCKKDYSNYSSALSGPVPVQVATMLGLSLDMFNIETNEVKHYDLNKDEFIDMSLETYKELNKPTEDGKPK